MVIKFVLLPLVLLFPAGGAAASAGTAAVVLDRHAKDTLTPVELDVNDTVRFRLASDQTRVLTLRATAARYLWTNVRRIREGQRDAAGLYMFSADVTIDGQPLRLERYVNSQESFYEPMVINGMRLWLDGVQDIFEFLNENHGECRPRKKARFVLQDAAHRICPEEVRLWYRNDRLFIPIGETYNGDNAWMGAHKGADAHGGLDIDQPKGSPSFTPIAFDDQFLFQSLARGDDNNRWRGIRKWASGDIWTLQVHHLLDILEPEHIPLKAGVTHATNAGTHLGAQYHAHYYFRIKVPGEEGSYVVDPWIVHWQSFEDEKRRRGGLQADFVPPGPASTAQAVAFDAGPSRLGTRGLVPQYYWSFSDGSYAVGPKVSHAFATPGVHSATLTIYDGGEYSARTKHLTVSGSTAERPALGLAADRIVAFRPRPAAALDVYGWPPRTVPGTLSFTVRPTRPVPKPKQLRYVNLGGGTLPAIRTRIEYLQGGNWLNLKSTPDVLDVAVNGQGVAPGRYTALVHLDASGALNPTVTIRVEMLAPIGLPNNFEHGEDQQVIVDNEDTRFEATPWFWVGGRFAKVEAQGYRRFYLTNGGRAQPGEFARFVPDLMAGDHEVSFVPETPFSPDTRFAVRVTSARGEKVVWVEPASNRVIGTFAFQQGTDGAIDLLTEGSTGQVLADALIFKRVPTVWVLP